jgi:hypothetical protein
MVGEVGQRGGGTVTFISKFNEAERKQIAAEYVAGEKAEVIALKHHCTPQYPGKLAKRLGLPLRGRGKSPNGKTWTPMSEEEKARALQLREAGLSYRRIGEILGRHKATINYFFSPESYRKFNERRARDRIYTTKPQGCHERAPEVPEHVLAERDRRMAYWPSITGDPPPGYSALDRRA